MSDTTLASPHDYLKSQIRWRPVEIGFWLATLLPFVVTPNYLVLASQIAITALFALSLDLILGYAGIVSLGHAAFFGFGAYTAGIVSKYGWGEPVTGLLISGIAAGLLGYVLSFVIARFRHLALIMMTLGIGLENVVAVESDAEFRLRPEALERAIAADRAAGMRPVAVVGVLGTTSTTSVDPLAAIGAIARREGLWFHVDAAYAGVTGCVPEFRHHMAGTELADSLVVNPHKWLFTPMDCSVLLVRRPEPLKRAFSLVPAYLETAEQDAVLNYMDYGFQLGHRFRALKLWMVIRAFGVRGIADRLRHHCTMAAEFATWVRETPGWTIEAPHPFSVVCFRHDAPGTLEQSNAHNARILDRVNASGEVFLSHTILRGRYVLRVAVGNLRTERRHLERAWTLLREAGATA